MTVKEYLWNWDQQTFSITYETLGRGSPVLLLPAFSTVSSRSDVSKDSNAYLTNINGLRFGHKYLGNRRTHRIILIV